jgi:uncharacterized membrane protein YkgB
MRMRRCDVLAGAVRMVMVIVTVVMIVTTENKLGMMRHAEIGMNLADGGGRMVWGQHREMH